MYFFGYKSFISSYGTVGVSLNKHLNLQGGYQLSSRLNIKAQTNRRTEFDTAWSSRWTQNRVR